MGPCKDPRWLVPEACTPAPVSLQVPLLFLIWVLMLHARPAPMQPQSIVLYGQSLQTSAITATAAAKSCTYIFTNFCAAP